MIDAGFMQVGENRNAKHNLKLECPEWMIETIWRGSSNIQRNRLENKSTWTMAQD